MNWGLMARVFEALQEFHLQRLEHADRIMKVGTGAQYDMASTVSALKMHFDPVLKS